MQTLSRSASSVASGEAKASMTGSTRSINSKDFSKQPLTFNIYIGETTKQFWSSGANANSEETNVAHTGFGRKALESLHLTCCLKSNDENNSNISENDSSPNSSRFRKCTTPAEVKSRYKVTSSDYESWRESFDSLMASEAGREIFRLFCEGEFSDENIKFWNTVQTFIKNNERNSEAEIRKSARVIYDDFISVSAATQVSLTYPIQQKIQDKIQNIKTPIDEDRQQLIPQSNKNQTSQSGVNNSDIRVTMASPGHAEHVLNEIQAQTIFSEAIQHVYNVMKRDIYIRFKKSELMVTFGKSLE